MEKTSIDIHLKREETALLVRNQVANPSPLGLAAFALTTFVLSTFNTKLIDPSLEKVVLPLALFYGGAAQVIAGIFEFIALNSFAATAFISYGAFWMSFAGYVKYELPLLDPASAHLATGLFLLAWTIFTFYMLVASLRTSVAVVCVFASLTVTFLALTIGQFGDNVTATRAGGWLGLVTAAAAWYASAATIINTTWKRTVFPVGALLAPQDE